MGPTMSEEAREISERAGIVPGPQHVDHDEQRRMERRHARQLAAAIRADEPDEIAGTVLRHMEEWSLPGRAWPRTWPRWRDALDHAQAQRARRAD